MNLRSVIFRADASVEIGSGHVMRCLALAQELKKRGVECRFICREYRGNYLQEIRRRGYMAYGLPALSSDTNTVDIPTEYQSCSVPCSVTDWARDAEQTKALINEISVDWVVVDHYLLDFRWERALRPICRFLMVIDDLADRPHDCDILLDQNYYSDIGRRYQGLLMRSCNALLGLAYVLLRPEFEMAKRRRRQRDGTVKRILIFFGSSDPTGQTQAVLAALQNMGTAGILVDVVVGDTNPNRHLIKQICDRTFGVSYYNSVRNMAELIVKADLGVGAGGSSMWERCYLGLPTITVSTAKNQKETTEDTAKLGAIEYLGPSNLVSSNTYECAISDLISDPVRVKKMSDAALAIGSEIAKKSVVSEMFNFTINP